MVRGSSISLLIDFVPYFSFLLVRDNFGELALFYKMTLNSFQLFPWVNTYFLLYGPVIVLSIKYPYQHYILFLKAGFH